MKNYKAELEKIMLEQYPDKLYAGKFDLIGFAYGRGQTVNRIIKLFREIAKEAFDDEELQELLRNPLHSSVRFKLDEILSNIEKLIK